MRLCPSSRVDRAIDPLVGRVRHVDDAGVDPAFSRNLLRGLAIFSADERFRQCRPRPPRPVRAQDLTSGSESGSIIGSQPNYTSIVSQIDLKSPDALDAVIALREGSRSALTAIYDRLSPELKGKRCLVLGSAPDTRVPRPGDYDRCICINGSPFVAHASGIAVDLVIMVGFTTAMKKDISALSIEKLKDLQARDLLFISAGDALEHALAVLESVDFRFQSYSQMNALERAAIVGELCIEELGLGQRDDRISNGVFAVVLALWCGAAEVIVSGISLSGGHAYAAGTQRDHQNGDRRCLMILAERFADRLCTTSVELRSSFSLRLVDA
jgi:hypothetical protein